MEYILGDMQGTPYMTLKRKHERIEKMRAKKSYVVLMIEVYARKNWRLGVGLTMQSQHKDRG